ncbi:MAG: hypothetical protein EXS37_12345 [Opitutus sp.]|nr:hypothetical protein [Opitutus sp.]
MKRAPSLAAGVAVLWIALAHAATPPAEKRRLVLCNDGGTLAAPSMEAPIGVEGLVRATIDPLRGTMIDTLYWQLGTDLHHGAFPARLSDWYSHRTKVGAIWGSDREIFRTAAEWRIFENTRTLFEQGTDPAAVVIEHGHKAGLDVFLALRINDGHDAKLPGGLTDPNMAPQRRARTDWLLGDDAALMEGIGGLAGQARTGYDFARPEVRSYMLALVAEAVANYDLDGFDLDFCRQPSLFKKGEAEKSSPLLTQLLRDIRAALDAKSRAVKRPLFLSVRVPPDLSATKKIGLDVATWITERLVNIVVVGDPGGWNYRLPIERFVELAKGTGCKILAQNLCAFREDRGRSASVLFGERNYYTTEQFRAVAARHWQAGADGMFIWNQHFLKYSADDRFDPQSWREIGDPAVLASKNKHYLVGPTGRGGSLPIELAAAGARANVNVEIADDVSGERKRGTKVRATLRLSIDQLTALDRVEFRLNDSALDRASAIVRLNYNDCWLDFDVTDTIRKGSNALTLTVTGRNPHVAAPLVVRSVEALVTFEGL